VRRPRPGAYAKQRLASLPVPRTNNEGGLVRLDLRSADLSSLEIADRLSDLLQAHFDSQTIWPFAGPSWVVPYLAGLYALACQANPAMTPESFWATALKTGQVTSVVYEGKRYELGTIVNPAALIGALQK
jgi:hypothetical protein